MLPIHRLFIIFIIVLETTINSINSFNTCHLERNCVQSSVDCNNATHLCFCRTNIRLSPTGVCLQSASVNTRCMLYQPCLNANCLLTNGLELNFNDREKRNTVWQSLLELVLYRYRNKQLGLCRCDKSRPRHNCNYRVIGSHCSDQRHCSQSVAYSQCTSSGVCVCNQTHYHFDDNCLLKKSFDQFCSDSTECQTNLYCKASQCRCKKNYEFDVDSGLCQYRSGTDSTDVSANGGGNFWDHFAKVGGFIIIIVLMLFLCTKKESELQNESITGSHRRRNSSRANRNRSSSINSHRPLTQTSSNASRSSAYRTFEESVPIKQTIIVPSPAQLIRSLSSSSDEVDYNPYQFDTLFPQQSDNDDPPSYEDVVKDVVKDFDKH